MTTDAKTLNDRMDFDHVIRVTDDGEVVDGPAGVYAPTLWDGELDSGRWEMLNGYSRQDGYPGPIMHSSEYIGSSMARDILAKPGVYVAVVAEYSPEDDDPDGEPVAEGWAVCRLIELAS